MNLSRTLVRGICIGTIAFGRPTFAERTNEIAEAARPIDEGVPEVAVYQLQKLIARLNGVDKIRATGKLAEALIAAQRSTEAIHAKNPPPSIAAQPQPVRHGACQYGARGRR